MNIWIGNGRLTADPEIRYTTGGAAVTNFSIAVEGKVWKDKDGQLCKDTQFINCEAWNGTGEFVSKHFSKGDAIEVRGSIRNNDWEDQEGNKRRSTFIRVDEVSFCLTGKNKQGKESDGENEEVKTEKKSSPKNTKTSKVPSSPKKTARYLIDEEDLDIEEETL